MASACVPPAFQYLSDRKSTRVLQPWRPTGDLEWFHYTFRFFLSGSFVLIFRLTDLIRPKCNMRRNGCSRVPHDDDEYIPCATNKVVSTLSNQLPPAFADDDRSAVNYDLIGSL
jgi:hypothetical protein